MVNNINNPSVNISSFVNALQQTGNTAASSAVEATNTVALGQNVVTASDKDGAGNAASVSFGDAPILAQPDASQVAAGKASLFGSSQAIVDMITLLMNSIDANRESRQISREVGTAQQNAAETAGFQQIDKLHDVANSIRNSAIVSGVVGGLGAGLSTGGLVGTFKKAKLAKTGDVATAFKSNKLESKIEDLRLKFHKNKIDKYGAANDGTYNSTKLTKHQNKWSELNDKVEAKKNGTYTGMDKAAKYELMDMIMQTGTGITNSAQSTYNTVSQSQQKTMEAQAQFNATIAERDKTDRSKSEDQRDSMKRTTDSLLKTLSDILSALNQASSAASRA